jgi:hypothetical protein
MLSSRFLFLLPVLLLAGLVTLGSGCGSKATSSTSPSTKSSSADGPFTKADVKDACALISKDMVRQATGLPDTASLGEFTVPRNTDTPNSCSYTWSGPDQEANGRISHIKVYEDAETAKMFFDDLTPTMSNAELQKRVEGATETAQKDGRVTAKNAETLQSMAESMADDTSGKAVVWVDVADIGTRARVELKGAMSTSYETAVQYKNLIFKTAAYYGPNADNAIPNADITELGADYTAKFKDETKDRRIRMGKTLAQLITENLKTME